MFTYATYYVCVSVVASHGCGASSFLVTPVANTSELQEISVQPGRAFGGKIAIIEVEGMLLDDRSGGILQPSENPLEPIRSAVKPGGG